MGLLSNAFAFLCLTPFLTLALHMLVVRSDETLSFLVNQATSGDLIVFVILLSISLFIFYRRKTFWYFTPTAVACIVILLNDLKTKVDLELLPEYSYSSLLKHEDLSGTVTIVTGANSGIGFMVSKTMVDLGSTVILACRSESKCAIARDKIMSTRKKSETGEAIPRLLDLSSFKSVRDFSDRFIKDFDRLDFLINNAGFASPPAGTKLTQDGLEIGLGAMHFGHFLLTMELSNLLKSTAAIRKSPVIVVNVASAAGQFPIIGAKFHKSIYEGDGEGDLRAELTPVFPFQMYARAKLANILFTRELSKRFQFVRTCSMHVGAVATSIWDSGSKILQPIIDRYTSNTMRSLEEGSRVVFRCILEDSLENGVYLDGMGIEIGDSKKNFNISGTHIMDDKLASRLWEVSKKITKNTINT